MEAGIENDKKQTPKGVTEKTVENILKNPFYIGKHRSKNGEVWDCKHPALIDNSLFNKVQQISQQKCRTIHYIDKPYFAYRGLLRCQCGRSYSPYVQKGFTYYRCRCKTSCTNKCVNLREDEVDKRIMSYLDQLYFSDEELIEIEAGAKTGLDKIATKRETELQDLEQERKRIYGDLDYLKKNKVTLLRTRASTAEEYTTDVERLEAELKLNEEKMGIYRHAESEMLQYVLTFSELVKMASQYYKHALDSEKREITTNVFTELVYFNNEFLFEPKEAYSALFQRHEYKRTALIGAVPNTGSGGGVRTRGQSITRISSFPKSVDYIIIRS